MCFLYLIQGLNKTVMTKIITSGHTLMAVRRAEHRFSRSVLLSLNVIFPFLFFFKQLQELFNIFPRPKNFFFSASLLYAKKDGALQCCQLSDFVTIFSECSDRWTEFFLGGVKRLATNLANLSAAVGDFWWLGYVLLLCLFLILCNRQRCVLSFKKCFYMSPWMTAKAVPMCACTNGK